ncbi:hypothetical protein [Pseudomonas sp. Marseille-Q5115]|uniref:hypothetical protein n=1 Tax=Pseudomonas sp. Marseille-Q5115 TaxID=2866593 RepID=UPI001CE48657|nr:hypothetical protein [Pseudomonas sp. Marseille-Q5115]
MDLERRNNVQVSGDGPVTLVFSHGFGCDQSMWRQLAPGFSEQFRVITYDLVGAGGSDLSAYDRLKYGHLKGYAQDLLTIGGKIFHQTHWLPLMRIQGSVRGVKLDVLNGRRQRVVMMIIGVRSERDGASYHHLAFFERADRDSYEREILAARKAAELASQAKTDVEAALRQARDELQETYELARDRLIVASALSEPRIAFAQAVIEHRQSGEGMALFDGDRVRQLVANLAANSVAYGDLDHPVRVTTEITAHQLRVSVHNAGQPFQPKPGPRCLTP